MKSLGQGLGRMTHASRWGDGLHFNPNSNMQLSPIHKSYCFSFVTELFFLPFFMYSFKLGTWKPMCIRTYPSVSIYTISATIKDRLWCPPFNQKPIYCCPLGVNVFPSGISVLSFTGSCFLRTDQLDGETDWKLRLPVACTQRLPTAAVSHYIKMER